MLDAPKKPSSHRLRRGRSSIAGQTYLITFCTMGRHPYFQQHTAAMAVAAKFREPALWGNAQILAWVLMPDHFHGLVTLSDENISRMMQRVKACTARASGLNASIWMPGFHDHALRGTEAIADAVEYIMMNPVRAGLCERWDLYPHLATVIPLE